MKKIIENDEILKLLPKNRKIWLVGGYLRDYFLKKPSVDRDIVVEDENAKDFAKKFADDIKGHFIELDAVNAIYRVVLADKINYFDIVNPLNFSIEEDMKRRDFTVNSLFLNLQTFELLGSVADIEGKIIKTARLENLADDPLRCLRAFRFAAILGFEICPEILNFIEKNSQLIHKCAKERISYEILRLFEGQNASATLKIMHKAGFLRQIFPFVDEIEKIPANSHHHLNLLGHSIEVVRQLELLGQNEPLLKLCGFLHDIGKPKTHAIIDGRHRFIGHDELGATLVKPFLEGMKFSKKQIKFAQKMIKYHIYPSALMHEEGKNPQAMARFVRKIEDDVPALIALAKADRLSARGVAVSDEAVFQNLQNLGILQKFYEENAQTLLVPLQKLLDGTEICKALGLEPSKELGKVIAALKEAQLAGAVKTREDALKFIFSLK